MELSVREVGLSSFHELAVYEFTLFRLPAFVNESAIWIEGERAFKGHGVWEFSSVRVELAIGFVTFKGEISLEAIEVKCAVGTVYKLAIRRRLVERTVRAFYECKRRR